MAKVSVGFSRLSHQRRLTYLDVVFGKLLRKRAPSRGGRVHSVVYRNLAILVIKPSVDVLAAFLQNLLTKHH